MVNTSTIDTTTCTHPICAGHERCLVACAHDRCTEQGRHHFADVYASGALATVDDRMWCDRHVEVGRAQVTGYRTEIRDPQGGRNLIRQGDTVRVGPSKPGRKDGFDAEFRRAHVVNGVVTEIEVFGGRRGRAAVRTFIPERIRRRVQMPKRGAA